MTKINKDPNTLARAKAPSLVLALVGLALILLNSCSEKFDFVGAGSDPEGPPQIFLPKLLYICPQMHANRRKFYVRAPAAQTPQ